MLKRYKFGIGFVALRLVSVARDAIIFIQKNPVLEKVFR
jgi:hypothetical protein